MKEILAIRAGRYFALLMLLASLILTGCDGGGGGNSGGTIRLAWDANSEDDLAGYKVYYGTASGAYTNSKDVGMATQSNSTVYYALEGLTPGQIYFIAVTAYNTSGSESDFSNEVSGAPK